MSSVYRADKKHTTYFYCSIIFCYIFPSWDEAPIHRYAQTLTIHLPLRIRWQMFPFCSPPTRSFTAESALTVLSSLHLNYHPFPTLLPLNPKKRVAQWGELLHQIPQATHLWWKINPSTILRSTLNFSFSICKLKRLGFNKYLVKML